MKEIIQYKFDKLVKENIVDFEMSREEAVEEATTSITTEGHDLNGIDKSVERFDDNGEIANVRESSRVAILNLQSNIKNFDKSCYLENLKKLNQLTLSGLSEKIIITEEGVVKALSECLAIADQDNEVISASIDCYKNLISGQPDTINSDDLLKVLKYLSSDDGDIIEKALQCISESCLKHENNRNLLSKNDITDYLMKILENFTNNQNVIKECCSLIAILLTDDDLRVPFGKASDRAQEFVKRGMLTKLLNLVKDYKNVKEVYQALSKLTIRNEFCKEVLDSGGVEFLLDSLSDPENSASLLKSKISLIKAVSGNDDAKIEIAKRNGIEIILNSLNTYMKNAPIAEISCATLASVVLRQPNHSNIVIENGGAELISRVISVHMETPVVLSSACLLIRNLVSRVKEHSTALLDRGIEEQLRMIGNRHKNCADSVKSALRDLGCQVSLREEWKGEGHNLER